MTTLPPEPEPVTAPPPSAHRRVVAAFERLAQADRPDLWTSLRTLEEVLVDAKSVDERVRAGEDLPLAGTVLAVADLIDVAGLPTVGCPGFSQVPVISATAVTRLTGAGAVVLGKTASGALASAGDPDKVAGGPGSGSAVAVALGITDLGLATDTAGAGRVPAALNAVLGLKPTPGLVPKTGVATASSFDCVSVFASRLVLGQRALAEMTGPDGLDASVRPWPADARLAAGDRPRLAIPGDAALTTLSTPAKRAFRAVVASLTAAGAETAPIDLRPFFEAGQLLSGAAASPEPARTRVTGLRAAAREALAGFDALVLPTVPAHPDLGEALADPAGVAARLAAYTAFVNVLDLAAVTVPAGPCDSRPYGVTIATRAFEDQVALDLAGLLTGEPTAPYPPEGVDLVVFGAHLRGQPLHELLRGARFTGPVRTVEGYRMVLLGTDPPQPGVLTGRRGIDGESWRLAPAAFERFAASLAGPLVLDRVTLEDGSTPLAVLGRPDAVEGALELDRFESWRGYLRFVSTAGSRSPG